MDKDAGCGLLPDFMVKDDMHRLEPIPRGHATSYKICAVWPDDGMLLKSMQAFFATFTEVAGEKPVSEQ